MEVRPVTARFVVVAFVVDAFVANSERKVLCALKLFWVVVENANDITLAERDSG